MYKNTKLFYLINSLNSEEFRWFSKFIRSPYFNSNEHLIKLYGLIKKYNRNFEHPKLQQKAIFDHLFPGEKLDEQRLRLLFHRLTKLVEKFLVVDRLKKDELEYDKLLIKSLERPNTYEFFESKTNTLLKKIEASQYRDEFYFIKKKELYVQYYRHPATNRYKLGETELQLAMENLDDYYALSKVKLACAFLARSKTLSEKVQIKYLDLAREHAENSHFLGRLYSLIILLQEQDELSALFEEIKQLFTNHIREISPEDQRNILYLLLNHVARLINKGRAEYIVHTFELYKIGLEHRSLIIHNELTESTYINIIVSGIGSHEFTWVENFLEEYSTYLDQTIRDSAMTYGKAYWYFYQKQFDQSIKILNAFTFSKPLQIVTAKTLLIRAYIEMYFSDSSYYDLSISQLNTFEKYIRKNKVLSSARLRAYLNFTSAAKKLLSLKMEKKDLQELEVRLMDSQNLILKRWLLEKVRQK